MATPRNAHAVAVCAAVVLASGVREILRRRRQPGGALRAASLLCSGALLLACAIELQVLTRRQTGLAIDTASLRATFAGINTQGPERQLVFHYRLENTRQSGFRLEGNACAGVGFRFVKGGRSDPAAALLEKDPVSYKKYTGLVRLSGPAGMVLQPCPLELAPGQSEAVAIAVPYGYPGNSHPSEDELKLYVRAAMPRVDGFGTVDFGRKYAISFPKGW